jgi:hypothetical protein
MVAGTLLADGNCGAIVFLFGRAFAVRLLENVGNIEGHDCASLLRRAIHENTSMWDRQGWVHPEVSIPNEAATSSPTSVLTSKGTPVVVRPYHFQYSLNPDDSVGTLTWGATTGCQLRYDDGFVADSGPQPASMLVYYKTADLTSQIGDLSYYGGDSGKVCAIYYNGVQYEKDTAGNTCTFRNSDLSSGTNLLIIG